MYIILHFVFFWRRVDLQCCVRFRCTVNWFSDKYAYVNFFQILFPFKLLQNIKYSSLCYGKNLWGGNGVAKSWTQLSMRACHSHLISPGKLGHYDCLPINIGHSVTLRIFCNAVLACVWCGNLEKTHLESVFPSSFLYRLSPLVSLPHYSAFLSCGRRDLCGKE